LLDVTPLPDVASTLPVDANTQASAIARPTLFIDMMCTFLGETDWPRAKRNVSCPTNRADTRCDRASN